MNILVKRNLIILCILFRMEKHSTVNQIEMLEILHLKLILLKKDFKMANKTILCRTHI